jgi:hypothetical protein
MAAAAILVLMAAAGAFFFVTAAVAVFVMFVMFIMLVFIGHRFPPFVGYSVIDGLIFCLQKESGSLMDILPLQIPLLHPTAKAGILRQTLQILGNPGALVKGKGEHQSSGGSEGNGEDSRQEKNKKTGEKTLPNLPFRSTP